MSTIKPVFKCLDIYKKQFKYSQCLLTISVGQEFHEGEKFSATVDLVNNAFKSCILLVDDTLQRHSRALGTTNNAESYYESSLREGDLWLERNQKSIQRLSILKSIERWDRWLKHDKFMLYKEKIAGLLDTDKNYRMAFELTVDEYLNRYYKRLTNLAGFDMLRARSLCLDYLIEECTAICLWPELDCQFEVYPSQRNLAMHLTHQLFILPNYTNSVNAVAIKFKNRKQAKAQYFNPESTYNTDNVALVAHD